MPPGESNSLWPLQGALLFRDQSPKTMLSSLLFASLLLGAQESPLHCPIMLDNAANMKSAPVLVGGFEFRFCCAGCDAKFKSDPAGSMKKAVASKKTVGSSLFDPTTGLRIKPEAAKGSYDFKGIRYYFADEAGLAKFKQNPGSFAASPKQDVLYCVVAKEEIKSYADAAAYIDHKGVRYYICCPSCISKFKAAPDSFTGNGKPKASGFFVEIAKP